ncbi:MAG: hypothetical protein HOC23_20670 [Halieaceae bacterium]|nr:hypothetical protein [Halieaceae bacterium]
MLFRPSSISFPHANDLDEGYIEQRLQEMGGRYLLLILPEVPGRALAYPDPFSSLSSVYSPALGILSSTTSMLRYREGCKTSYPVEGYPHGADNQFYPADITDLEGCHRLLPNHRLDLNSWKVARFWPREALQPDPKADADRHIIQAVERLRSNMLAAHATGLRMYSPLTAGRDSRAILACSSAEVRADASYVTLRFHNRKYGHKKDLHISRLLAMRHHLNHEIVSIQKASKDDRERYFYTIGRAGGTGKATKFYRTPLQSLDMNAIWITGHGEAVAKRHYAKYAGRFFRPTAADLLTRARLPRREDFLIGMERWLHDLPPHSSVELVVDLFYMEMRLGGSACPHLYGTAPFRVNITPFSDRRYAEACFALPYTYRQSGRAQARIVEMADPRLLDTPFEQLTGWPRIKHLLTLGKR